MAAKSLARNRGKYRATILALVVSIVLFVGVSSFSNILVTATSMIYADLGGNVIVTMSGDTAQRHNALAETLAGWDGVAAYPARTLSGQVALPEGALSDAYRRHFSGWEPQLQLYSVGPDEFAALCRRAGSGTAPYGDGELEGILVNATGTIIQQGRRISFTPFHLSAGDSVNASVGGRELALTLRGAVDAVPASLSIPFTAHALNVVVPDEAVANLWPREEGDFLWLSVMARDADAFTEQAQALLEEALPQHTWSVYNYEKMAANNRNITALVMLFVYGFIAMLTLIGVTSVITTISTSIALRTREFAMLRSAGMTEGAIARMLRYESLLYGIRSLVLGIPLGLLTCRLLYRAMTSVMDFPFQWPVQSMLIATGGVLLITLSTMSFARRKQRQCNIVDALRDDII